MRVVPGKAEEESVAELWATTTTPPGAARALRARQSYPHGL
jgi:hypothetical protein